MKLIIFTAIHGRVPMTKVFLSAMERIRKETGVVCYSVVTTDDTGNIEMLEVGNHPYVEYKNKPLGEKWNRVVEYVRDIDWTHLMILGSDDIPSTSFINHTLSLKGDIIGIQGMHFWGLNPRRAGFLKFGYWATNGLLGAGKVLSRKIIESCNYSPWPDYVNYGMDGQMMKLISKGLMGKRIHSITHKWKPVDHDVFLVDIKYEKHISSMSPILRRGIDLQNDEEVLKRHLPEDEVNYLISLKEEAIIKYEEKHGPIE